MAIQYINTGTALGALPKIKRDVNPDFAKPPTGTYVYLLFNLRGMEMVFNGIYTIAAEIYSKIITAVREQYTPNEFTKEAAEKRKELDSKGKRDIDLRQSDKTYLQLYKLYQQAFELYSRISSNDRLHAIQVYNSTVEAFKRLRQSVYRSNIDNKVQQEYKPKLRTKIGGNAKRVLEYLRNNGTDYLKEIKMRHLPVQDLSVKGLEALLQEA